MKSKGKYSLVLSVLFMVSSGSQKLNKLKSETVHVYGNCGMCKKTTEAAGYIDRIAQVEWSPKTKMASISYDSAQTTIDEILKRIAAAGYDSDEYRAPDEVYQNLHGCCQYERPTRF